jgi:hypothetical protein
MKGTNKQQIRIKIANLNFICPRKHLVWPRTCSPLGVSCSADRHRRRSGHFMAFPRHAATSTACAPQAGICILNLLSSSSAICLRRSATRKVFDDVGVPDAVQVRPVVLFRRIRFHWNAFKECNGNAVSASAVVRCRMKRLVQIANEMDQISQRFGSRLNTRGWIPENAISSSMLW